MACFFIANNILNARLLINNSHFDTISITHT